MSLFLDASVLLAGIVDVGPQSAPAQSILHAVAEKTLADAGTARHGCLEIAVTPWPRFVTAYASRRRRSLCRR